MKLKTTEVNGVSYAVIQDGKPVYVSDDGKEVAFDAPGTIATITRLNGEAKGHREAKEAAEAKLKVFDGLDAAAAKDAIEKIKKIDDKKLIDAGEVDKVREAAIKAVRDEMAPAVAERDKLRGELHAEKIGGSFSRSKFIADKLAIPADLVEARFGKHFEVVDGKIVAKDSAGNQIYSPSSPGNPAGFDEALEVLVNGYPQKDSILKGGNGGGGGAPGKGGAVGVKQLTRTQFEALAPADRSAKMKEGVTVVDG